MTPTKRTLRGLNLNSKSKLVLKGFCETFPRVTWFLVKATTAFRIFVLRDIEKLETDTTKIADAEIVATKNQVTNQVPIVRSDGTMGLGCSRVSLIDDTHMCSCALCQGDGWRCTSKQAAATRCRQVLAVGALWCRRPPLDDCRACPAGRDCADARREGRRRASC